MPENTPAPLATPTFISPVLSEFELKADFDEFDLSGRIETAIKENSGAPEQDRKAAMAEYIAFGLERASHDGPNPCFTPALVIHGRPDPDVSLVDAAIIHYWQARMTSVSNPVFQARYADVIWDLSKPCANLKPSIEACRTAVDAYVAASRVSDGQIPHLAEDRLNRALRLAVAVGDTPRVERVRDAMFDFARRHAGDRGWVQLFDQVFHNPRVPLDPQQREELLAEMEKLVTRVAELESGAGGVETMPVAVRLADHYESAGRRVDAERVIRGCGRAIERLAAIAHGILGHAWLSDLHAVYRDRGLRDDAERVLLAMKEKGAEAERQMVPLKSSTTIDADELNQALDGLTAGGLEAASVALVGTFLPSIDRIRRQAENLRHEFPVATMFNMVKLSEQQIVAKAGPADVDPNGSLIRDVAQDLGFSTFFLGRAIDRLLERYAPTAESFVTQIRLSPAFDEGDLLLICEGLDAYLARDFVKAIHVSFRGSNTRCGKCWGSWVDRRRSLAVGRRHGWWRRASTTCLSMSPRCGSSSART